MKHTKFKGSLRFITVILYVFAAAFIIVEMLKIAAK